MLTPGNFILKVKPSTKTIYAFLKLSTTNTAYYKVYYSYACNNGEIFDTKFN